MHSRRAGSSYRQPSGGSGGGRFKLFAMACLIIGPLWMWAYHENVPIAVTVWQAASDAYDSVASFSKETANDATTAISENMGSSQDTQEAGQPHARCNIRGDHILPRCAGDIASNKLTEVRGRESPQSRRD